MLELSTESGQMMPLLGSVLLTALICSVTERMEKCGIYIRGGVAAATAGGLFLLYRQILDGFALYWNTVADTFGSRAGIYFPPFGAELSLYPPPTIPPAWSPLATTVPSKVQL